MPLPPASALHLLLRIGAACRGEGWAAAVGRGLVQGLHDAVDSEEELNCLQIGEE